MEAIAKYVVALMKEYGFNPDARFYQAGSMDEVLLRAIESVKLGEDGYIYVPGRDGQEYASGGQPYLAIRWNRDRPNISYLVAAYQELVNDYYDTMMTIDRGGGMTDEEWIMPHQEGGAIQLDHITYNEPINDNMFVGAMVREGDLSTLTIESVAASIVGSYRLINHLAPNRDMRIRHLLDAMAKIGPDMKV